MGERRAGEGGGEKAEKTAAVVYLFFFPHKLCGIKLHRRSGRTPKKEGCTEGREEGMVGGKGGGEGDRAAVA